MLTDINSDFGIDGQPFEVYGDDAIMNWLKNVFRRTPGSDRYEYITSGLDFERLLKEPPSDIRAREILLMVMDTLRYNLPQLKISVQQSRVLANVDTGEYDVSLYINNTNFEFSI